MTDIEKLLGRKWTVEYDCYAFVRDVYADLCGAVLTDYARPLLWWAKNPELDLIRVSFRNEGFQPVHVAPRALQAGDGLLIALGGPTINHIGVHIGHGRFIHLPFRESSRVDLYGGTWMDRTIMVVRNPSLRVPDTRPYVNLFDLLPPSRQERYRALAATLPHRPR